MTGGSVRPGRGVVVVGGGVAGLVVALDLAGAGHRPVLLEAADSFGGVVSSHRVAGMTLDAGAESFATARPAVTELLAELGLAGRIVRPNPVGAWVRYAAGSAPLPATGFLGIPGHPFAADVRRVVGLAGVARCAGDAVLPAGSGFPPGATLGAIVRSRMGRRVLERLVEPVAGGVYAADPDQLEIDTVAPTLGAAVRQAGSLAGAVRALRGGGERAGSAVATLTGGLHTLVPSLVDAARDRGADLRTGVAVSGLVRDAGDWLVELAGGERIAAAAVVLAVPAPQAVGLLGIATPGVRLSALRAPITPVLICTLVLDDRRLDGAPRGTGVLVSARVAGIRAKALTHATAKWPWLAEIAGRGRHVLRLSYGRGGSGSAGLPAEDELPGVALADAADLLGVRLAPASVVDSVVVRWTSALPAPRPGHAAGVRDLRAALAASGLAVVGAAVAGSGLAGVVDDARRQASELTRRLGARSGGAPVSAPSAGEPTAG